MSRSRPPEYVRECIREELPDALAEPVLETDVSGEAYGVIGIDSENRVVFYDDDGHLIRKPITEDGVAGHQHPRYETTFRGFKPHSGEGAIRALDTSEWRWIHPRYRWVDGSVQTEKDMVNAGP